MVYWLMGRNEACPPPMGTIFKPWGCFLANVIVVIIWERDAGLTIAKGSETPAYDHLGRKSWTLAPGSGIEMRSSAVLLSRFWRSDGEVIGEVARGLFYILRKERARGMIREYLHEEERGNIKEML
jgi:hypothetical protein